MPALAITISILILIAVLRFGVIIEYSEAGFLMWVKVAFLKFRIADKDKKQKPKKEKAKDKKSDIGKQIKPGSLREFLDILKAVSNVLDRLRRRLLIKQLTIYYVSAGEDAANTAIMYGAAHAVYNTVIPLLESRFRIKHKDLRAAVDFNTSEQKIYLKIAISIAVWEVFYIVSALFPIIAGIFKKTSKTAVGNQDIVKRKEGQDNGKSSDQRSDGKNNGENEGND